MAKLKFEKVFLPKEDKKACKKIFKEYKKTYNYLNKLSVFLDAEVLKMDGYAREKYHAEKIDDIFSEETEDVCKAFLEVPRALEKLTFSFVKRIEQYFIKKYNLKKIKSYKDFMIPEDHRFIAHYNIIVKNINMQIGNFPKKTKNKKDRKAKNKKPNK